MTFSDDPLRSPRWNARKGKDEEEEQPKPRKGSKGGAVGAVIPYKNLPALAAYYLGIVILLPCIFAGGFLGIIPLGLGIFGLVKAAKDAEARGRLHAWIGIALGTFEILSTCVMAPAVYFWFYGIPRGLM